MAFPSTFLDIQNAVIQLSKGGKHG